jgi:hypothetical protein
MQCRACVATEAMLCWPSQQELIRPCRCRADKTYVHRACLANEPSTDHCSNCNMTYVRQDVSWVWWIRNVACAVARFVLSPNVWRQTQFLLILCVLLWPVALLLRHVAQGTQAPLAVSCLAAYKLAVLMQATFPWTDPRRSISQNYLLMVVRVWTYHHKDGSIIPHVLMHGIMVGNDAMVVFREQYRKVLHARQLDMIMDLSLVESPELMDTLLEHVPIHDLCVLVARYMHG